MTPDDLLAAKSVLVVGWLAVLFVVERLAPVARWPSSDGRAGWRRLVRNAGLWATATVTSALVVLPITVTATGLGAVIDLRPAWWSGAPAVLLDFLILDLWIYWWHRANHAVAILWRFHEVHHLDHTLDTTSALRFHLGELALSAVVRAPLLIVLGVPLETVLLFDTLVLVAALFHHANMALPAGLERALSRVIVTPSIHWVHHHARRADTDSNYATVLSLWDRVFKSRSPTRRTPDLPIGVDGRPELSLARLLLRPFVTPWATEGVAEEKT